jgi:hypothetical protein
MMKTFCNRTFAALFVVLGIQSAYAQATDPDCEELLALKNVRLEDVVTAGCQLSPEQISTLIDNPVGEVVSIPLQFDRLSLAEQVTGRDLTVETTKLIPTFPVRVGDNWSLVNRVVIPKITLPIDSSALAMLGTRPDVGLIEGDPTAAVFSGSTEGVGDLAYVGLFTPRESRQTPNGKIIWAVGPTAVLPTADEDILGQGQYQLGPAVAYGFLGNKWNVGALAQHWWSVGGDSDRSSINQTNIQYFYYYKLGNQWSIGASPNVSMDWTGSGSPTINLPIGIGINKTLFIGRLPVRIGLEASRYVKHESALEPEWGVRLAITPAIPSAFLSNLGGG